jgi:predicted Ser/Thr protein kinase
LPLKRLEDEEDSLLSKRFYRHKFYPLLQKENKQWFEEELKKEQKHNPYLPHNLTQESLRSHFQQWFGFPLLTLPLSKEVRKKFIEQVPSVSHKLNDKQKRLFELSWNEGGLSKENNEPLSPDIYATTKFFSVPRSSRFETLEDANKIRNQLKELYHERDKQYFASVTPCLQIYPPLLRDQQELKCNPKFSGTFRGAGAEGDVYDPADTQCNSLCSPDSCVVKTRKTTFTKDFFKIIELLEKKASIRITPSLQAVWKCGELFYLLYNRIHGKTLYQWKREHAMDQIWHFDKLDDQTKEENKNLFNVIMQRLLIKLKAMHQVGICHRDLHEGNVLVDEKLEPWIIDFENADLVSNTYYQVFDFNRIYNRNGHWLDSQTEKKYLEYKKQLEKDAITPYVNLFMHDSYEGSASFPDTPSYAHL